MPESSLHARLVDYLKLWIEKHYNQYDPIMKWIASAKENNPGKPPKIDGSIPDILFKCKYRDMSIVGEAETFVSIQNAHTYVQLRKFITYCAKFDWHLIVAVPLDISSYTKNLMKLLKYDCGVDRTNIHVPLIPRC